MTHTRGRTRTTRDEIVHAETPVTPEDQLIDTLTIDHLLYDLPDADRDLLWLRYAYRCPRGYRGRWPAPLQDIGFYLGRRYGTPPLSAQSVRDRTHVVLGHIHRKLHRGQQRAKRARLRIRGG